MDLGLSTRALRFYSLSRYIGIGPFEAFLLFLIAIAAEEMHFSPI